MAIDLHPHTVAGTESFVADSSHPFVPPAFQRLRHDRLRTRRCLPKNPRIVHVIGSLGNGGAERQLVNLLLGLADRDFNVSVLTTEPLVGPNAFHLPTLQDRGIRTAHVNQVPDFGALSHFPYLDELRAQIPCWLNPWPFCIVNSLMADPPDILHVWLDFANVVTAIAALMLGTSRIILSTRSVNPTHFPTLNIPWYNAWYRFLATIEDITLINNSDAGRDDYAGWLHVPSSRFQVIRNGIDTVPYGAVSVERIAAFREELQLAPGGRLVTGVFRLSEEKRPLMFIDVAEAAMTARPDVHMLIVGGGPLEAQVRARIAGSPHALRMHLLPPRTDIHVIYGASHVLLQTSILEGTPNTLLEAQAAGCPVVTTPGGGAIECATPDRTGFIAATPASLVGALTRILDDAALHERLSGAAPGFVEERFGLSRMMSEVVALYQ